MNEEHPLRSVFTQTLPEILKQLQISLVVSTYQAGRVILVRYDEVEQGGEQKSTVNTHFRTFEKPMGIAARGNRLSIGGARSVWEYRNVPAAAAKVSADKQHDACYIPRTVHLTGNIDIHEMDWSDDNELWIVNTRFSCLCTLDRDHSFYPRWRPPFVSGYSPEDRCHLNGLAMRDGQPRYVTALGETDTRGGWRANKVNGGLIMDISNNKILRRGLSMPHSPRWYRDQLWVLESGKGSLSRIDPQTGEMETIAQMPGFTRGIDFIGPLAFIGLSKVRESAVFSGLPIVTEVVERACGVWVVNIESKQILGFLRFEAGVEEIFAVQVLTGIRFPEMLEWNASLAGETYVLPDDALAEVIMPTQEKLDATPDAILARGMALFREGKWLAAADAFRQCLTLQADFPNARYSLGIALAEAGEWEEARGHLEAARDREPDKVENQLSLGSFYQRIGEPVLAMECFREAIRRDKDNPLAHLSLATLLLQLGEYRAGFEEYEWRLQTGQVAVLQAPQPRWQGEMAEDKTLLVYLENEDPRHAILLCRLLKAASTRVKRIIVTCPATLGLLFSVVEGVGEVRTSGSVASAEFDLQIPLESMPYVLGFVPDRDDYRPALDADRIKARCLDAKTLEPASQPSVGIVWRVQGGADKQQDNDRVNTNIECTLELLQPLFDVKGIRFVLLSESGTAVDLSGFESTVITPLEEPRDMNELAAIVAQLDLVVGVDSTALHLAGSMGRECWYLKGALSDWCWPSKGDASAWYPQARIFSQATPGDWNSVISPVRQALEHWRTSIKVA